MTHLAAVPLWAAIPAALLLLLGAGLTVLGTLGLAATQAQSERIIACQLPGTIEIMKARKKPLIAHWRRNSWIVSRFARSLRPISHWPKCQAPSRGSISRRSSQMT